MTMTVAGFRGWLGPRRGLRWVLPAVAAVAAAAPARAQDSNVVRARAVLTVEQDLQRLARQLEEMRSYELQLVRLMQREQERISVASDEAERKTIEELVSTLRSRMQSTFTERRAKQRELESLCRSVPRAQGWVGVAVNSRADMVEQKNGQFIIRYVGRPVVESVDPGSPADKAGIRSGDILIAIDGRDLQRGGVSLADLQPDTKLPFTVLRGDSEMRTLVVKVEPRPDALNQVPCPWVDARIAAALAPTPAEFYRYEVRTGPQAGARAGGFGRIVRARSADTSAASTIEPSGGAGYVSAPFAAFSSARGSIAGMVVRRLSESLAAGLGVSGGLLVEYVAPSLPAQRVGVRPDDVLLMADDTVLASPRVMQRIITSRTNSGERAVKLVVLRGKERQTVWLRW